MMFTRGTLKIDMELYEAIKETGCFYQMVIKGMTSVIKEETNNSKRSARDPRGFQGVVRRGTTKQFSSYARYSTSD